MTWSATTTENKTTKAKVIERLEYVRALFKEALKVQDAIDDITGEQEVAGQAIFRGDIEENYFNAVSNLTSLLDKFDVSDDAGAHAGASSSAGTPRTTIQNDIHDGIRLPNIPLPTFSGDYCQWRSFYDLFINMVHNKQKLSNSEKLYILKSYLSGEAADLVRSLQITDDNYDEARQILKNRYDNKRFIIDSLLKRFLNQPKVQTESASCLKKLLDTSNETVRALQLMAVPVNKWDQILVHIIVEKLDSDSRRHWELSLTRQALPTYDQLKSFIDARWQALELIPSPKITSSTVRKPSNHTNVKSLVAIANPTLQQEAQPQQRQRPSKQYPPCAQCSGPHGIYKCQTFASLTFSDKLKTVQEKRLCANCLRNDHKLEQCTSTRTCRFCNANHNTLLHELPMPVSTTTPLNPSTNAVTAVSANLLTASTFKQQTHSLPSVLLATAIILVQVDGTIHHIRALIDSGSQGSIITTATAHRLGLKMEHLPSPIPVHGVGCSESGNCTKYVNMNLGSRYDSAVFIPVTALVMPHITSKLPEQQLPSNRWPHLHGLQLADPHYHIPNKVEILIGADIMAQCLKDGQVPQSNGAPFAQNTSFGYILFGQIHSSNSVSVMCHANTIMASESSVDALLRSFWEIESLAHDRRLTLSEKLCEEHYVRTHCRQADGRFVVSLPFIESAVPLGKSRDAAITRLRQVEHRFRASPQFQDQYVNFMREYLELNHMELVPSAEVREPSCYLPHHGIMKGDKIRVVFDASHRTSSGVSLNNNLHIGHKLHKDLFDIIIRWRIYKYVFVADIRQMYRQILVAPADRDFQRIVWRNPGDTEVTDYRLRTVTYGTACAPFLAIRTIQQLANDAPKQFALASQVLLSETYVDDIMTGADNPSMLLQLKTELVALLETAQLELRKWSSNESNLLDSIPIEHLQNGPARELKIDAAVKALGIRWSPMADEFAISVRPTETHSPPTKRSILSAIASLFDPLGWIAPYIILLKILMQELWQLGVSWDDTLPTHISAKWLMYRNQFDRLANIRIPRWFGGTVGQLIDLHGFCDASVSAYAAVVYCRLIDNMGKIHVNIVAAKTKVAPLKTVSLPRLELCGANLLARLLTAVRAAINQQNIDVYAWCDSQVALSWLRGNPNRWQTFVANRVIEAISLVPPCAWKYINTTQNPADCASRGLSPEQLRQHQLWWQGPPWLHKDSTVWPKIAFNEINVDRLPEVRRMPIHSHVANIVGQEPNGMLEKYSSLTRLLRITALLHRFIFNCRNSSTKITRHINAADTRQALVSWVKVVQSTSFADEIKRCRNNESVLNCSVTRSLNPFLDALGVLRVGGRLANSQLTFEAKYPIILPKNNQLTRLIIAQAHDETLHGGQQLTMAHLRQEYWILGANQSVRKHIHQCTTCVRYRATTRTQLMGNLPTDRVTPSRAFSHTGIDYAGPIWLKTSRLRTAKMEKGYIAVFVCLATKAIHLEAVSELSSNACIAAINRFVARRGKCSVFYSDCGTNFVGADRELRQHFRLSLSDGSPLVRHLSTEGTDWQFIPPASPHFGGLWEAGVKSVKHHLRRVVGEAKLTYEEMCTVLCQIEACLNSRPLCPISRDPTDESTLTPGHFLIGEPLLTMPHQSLLDTARHRLNRWQYIQQLYQGFWRRWSTEYLNRLQQRPKWMDKKPNVAVGDLVLVKDEQCPPSKWPLARVISVSPGSDGLVRAVQLKCRGNVIKRPIAKLCSLPIQSCSPEMLQGRE